MKRPLVWFAFVFCLAAFIFCCLEDGLVPEYKDGVYTIRGVVSDAPRVKGNLAIFPFKSAGKTIVVYASATKKFCYGDELLITGRLQKFGRGLCLRVKSGFFITRIGKNKGFFLKAFALWLKEKIEEKIFRCISHPAAGILDAMVLGEKARVPPLVYRAMMKTGTVHILVVSGFNVGIVAFVIGLGLRFLRLKRKLRIYLTFPLLLLYCLTAGASTPVVRATIMALVFMSAYLLKREPDIYNSCAIAALIILSADPQKLFDIGLQLSFASVLAIVFFYPRIKAILRVEGLKPKWLQFLLNTLLVSFSAWVGTCGLIAFYFGSFSAVTVLANLFIVPQAVLLTLCGFSFVAASFICPALSPIFARPCEFLAFLLIKTNALLLKLPGAYFRIWS